MVSPALIAHGGAGTIGLREERPERGRAILEAVRRGARLLRSGASALEAVVAVVAAMEDHPLFNAGYGSVLTADGTIEMDASVMVATPGTNGRASFGIRAGAVAAVSRVRNPILLARAVMDHTRHVLMVGAG